MAIIHYCMLHHEPNVEEFFEKFTYYFPQESARPWVSGLGIAGWRQLTAVVGRFLPAGGSTVTGSSSSRGLDSSPAVVDSVDVDSSPQHQPSSVLHANEESGPSDVDRRTSPLQTMESNEESVANAESAGPPSEAGTRPVVGAAPASGGIVVPGAEAPGERRVGSADVVGAYGGFMPAGGSRSHGLDSSTRTVEEEESDANVDPDATRTWIRRRMEPAAIAESVAIAESNEEPAAIAESVDATQSPTSRGPPEEGEFRYFEDGESRVPSHDEGESPSWRARRGKEPQPFGRRGHSPSEDVVSSAQQGGDGESPEFLPTLKRELLAAEETLAEETVSPASASRNSDGSEVGAPLGSEVGAPIHHGGEDYGEFDPAALPEGLVGADLQTLPQQTLPDVDARDAVDADSRNWQNASQSGKRTVVETTEEEVHGGGDYGENASQSGKRTVVETTAQEWEAHGGGDYGEFDPAALPDGLADLRTLQVLVPANHADARGHQSDGDVTTQVSQQAGGDYGEFDPGNIPEGLVHAELHHLPKSPAHQRNGRDVTFIFRLPSFIC